MILKEHKGLCLLPNKPNKQIKIVPGKEDHLDKRLWEEWGKNDMS